ncbi:hypothetical protein BSL78_17155 [Apostichopus japonicus]|uniref:Protein anon-73B1 n=1 Tax=Stichopus japonicus TaxID=307972 RepID=A0A2G8KDE3_STIJA|nr:hypothetical protein BSL78_17155 [Apostichopus japonicus]
MAEEVSIEDLLVNEYSTIDKILEIGLYIGAVFQLVCIGAIFFLKSPDDDEEDGSGNDGGTSNNNTQEKMTKKDRAERKKKN